MWRAVKFIAYNGHAIKEAQNYMLQLVHTISMRTDNEEEAVERIRKMWKSPPPHLQTVVACIAAQVESMKAAERTKAAESKVESVGGQKSVWWHPEVKTEEAKAAEEARKRAEEAAEDEAEAAAEAARIRAEEGPASEVFYFDGKGFGMGNREALLQQCIDDNVIDLKGSVLHH